MKLSRQEMILVFLLLPSSHREIANKTLDQVESQLGFADPDHEPLQAALNVFNRRLAEALAREDKPSGKARREAISEGMRRSWANRKRKGAA